MFSRTYTPPTCTLKVTAKGLALLTWFGMQRQQRFSLSFDDPRVSEGEHITVKGDRYELDTLHKAVTTYVQEFINDSPNSSLEIENAKLGKERNILSSNSERKIQEHTIKTADAEVVNYGSQLSIDNQNIYVQPRDLLTHDLFLGSLGNKESGTFISLSMLQLYDLALALDESQTDLQTLPQFQSDSEVKFIPEWLHTAILILITAGLTAGAIKLYNRYAVNQQKQEENIVTNSDVTNSDATNSDGTNSDVTNSDATNSNATNSDATKNNNQEIPSQTSPTPIPSPTPTVSPSSLPTPPTNLPTTTIIKPSPIPKPSPLFPKPTSTTATPNNLPAPNLPSNIQNQGSTTTFVVPSAPSQTPPQIPSTATVKPAPIPSIATVKAGSVPSVAPVAPPRIPPVVQVTPPPIPPVPQLTPPPLPTAAAPNYGAPVQPRVPVQTPPNLQTQPIFNQTPLQDIQPNLNKTEVKPYFDVGSIPINLPKAIDLPPLEDVEPVAVRDTSSTVEPGNEEKKSQYSLLDKIPQVAEVREYFEENWEPPSDLSQDLQYSLLLNSDGSINKVTPINRASVEFYGDTNMPLEQKAFVSNIEGGKTAKIRLFLSRDGGVKTFLESLN